MDQYKDLIERLSRRNDTNIISSGDYESAKIFITEALNRQRDDIAIFSRFVNGCPYLSEQIIFKLKGLLCDGKKVLILTEGEHEIEIIAKHFRYETEHNLNIEIKKISNKFNYIDYGFFVTGHSYRFETRRNNGYSSFASFNGENIANKLKEKFNLLWNDN